MPAIIIRFSSPVASHLNERALCSTGTLPATAEAS